MNHNELRNIFPKAYQRGFNAQRLAALHAQALKPIPAEIQNPYPQPDHLLGSPWEAFEAGRRAAARADVAHTASLRLSDAA